MASEELKSQILTLIRICENCTEISVDKLVSNPHLGELNFEKARDDLDRAFSIFYNFLTLPTETLPDEAIHPIIQILIPLQKTIKDIKSFSRAANTDPVELRDAIVARLKREVDSFRAVTQKWVPYLVYQNSNVLGSINKISSATVEAERILTDAKAKKDEIDKAANEAKEAAATAKESAGAAGVKHFTNKFSREAEILKWLGIMWLTLTMVLSAVTLGVASYFLFLDLNAKDGYAAVQLITARLIILGVLLSATVWCGKIYKALRHQFTINRHRANAIATFQTFTAAASNDVTRDAVLTETTRAIFGPSATGYLDKEAASSGGDQLKVIEVVKQTSKALKSGPD